MFALVDCNNFYASCEKLFDPTLKDKPVVVLSNNDGCTIARSAEAKALGIKMGEPWFKMKDIAARYGIVAKSSNYTLYADMSNRVVDVLRGFTPSMEVYSIDESFLDLTGFKLYTNNDLAAYGQQIRRRVGQWVGLPVCVGIAPTKTLSKLANHIAKKRPAFQGVCSLPEMPADEVSRIFGEIEVGEVWGVGRRIAARLEAMQIKTVADLRRANIAMIRSTFGVVMERTVRELQGASCIELELAVPDKQQIICSRSFGRPVTTQEEINEALASYIGRAAEKLRAQGGAAGMLTIWLETNPFKPDTPQYGRTMTIPLPTAIDDTRLLIRFGLWGMKKIWRDGFEYKKCGCMLGEIQPKANAQGYLFAKPLEGSATAMAAMDRINAKFGRGTLKSAAEGIDKAWLMRRDRMSPAYTTAWDELAVVR